MAFPYPQDGHPQSQGWPPTIQNLKKGSVLQTFLTFINLYSIKLSVYKNGTIHNLIHNPIRFQLPDQECSLAFRLIVSSFIVCQGHSSGTVLGCLVRAQWSGARSPHCCADLLPSVRLCPRSSWFHFILVSCGTAFSFLISGHLSRI